eukprot:scaffold25632_cov63-Phaeocystis_antarctica.AAC.1
MARIEQGVLDKEVLRSMSVELSGGCRAQRTAGDVPHIVAKPAAGLDRVCIGGLGQRLESARAHREQRQ